MFLVCADYKETGIGLIQRHIEVDLTRPGVNTTVKINQPLDRLLLQEPDDVLAANAVVADHDNLASISQLCQILRNLSHRHVDTAVDMADLEFPRFADIE